MASKKYILLVDHNAPFAKAFCDRFTKKYPQADVQLADNARQALKHLSIKPCDLLIADLRLPEVDGLQLLLRLRQSYPHLTKVVMAANASPRDSQKAMEYGSVLYVEKPTTPSGYDTAVGKISEILEKTPEIPRGALGELKLDEMVDDGEQSPKDCVLVIYAETGAGLLYLQGGKIIHAETPENRGGDALKELLGWQGGPFEKRKFQEPGKRTLDVPWEDVFAVWMEEKSHAAPAPQAKQASKARVPVPVAAAAAPQAPAMPAAPSMPSAPSVPQAPAAPSMPAAPSAPAAEARPTAKVKAKQTPAAPGVPEEMITKTEKIFPFPHKPIPGGGGKQPEAWVRKPAPTTMGVKPAPLAPPEEEEVPPPPKIPTKAGDSDQVAPAPSEVTARVKPAPAEVAPAPNDVPLTEELIQSTGLRFALQIDAKGKVQQEVQCPDVKLLIGVTTFTVTKAREIAQLFGWEPLRSIHFLHETIDTAVLPFGERTVLLGWPSGQESMAENINQVFGAGLLDPTSATKPRLPATIDAMKKMPGLHGYAIFNKDHQILVKKFSAQWSFDLLQSTSRIATQMCMVLQLQKLPVKLAQIKFDAGSIFAIPSGDLMLLTICHHQSKVPLLKDCLTRITANEINKAVL